ncbi:MAG: glycoside hydrolase family 3 C-terminal domain-containing protein [Opitutales bacterium]|nr:glycoside hydrolase family 3 C-terminal domain-containing protein [Opitutales bacterium]
MIRLKSWTAGFSFITSLTALLMAVSSSAYTTSSAPLNYRNDTQMNEFIDDLMSRMTLEEKCGQLTMSAGHWNNTGPVVKQGGLDDIKEGRIGSFLSVYGADMTYQLQQVAVENSRLHIPLLFSHDVIHGFRTIFPVPIGQASSWDPDAVEEAAHIAAVEATASGVHWTYAPMVDIARDPRWGRIVEGWGEDPLLCSAMTVASVHGYQGNDLSRSDTLLACAKHFVAYGTIEGGRDYNSGEVTERTLREVYLPSFHAAVDAGVETFMSAFNDIGGVPCHANPYLTRGILRDEWAFPGLVVSDYTGIKELLNHGVADTREKAGIRALKAGVDIDMLSDIYNELPAAVKAGDLDISYIDEAVRRVLVAKYKLGLFEDPYRYCSGKKEAQQSLTHEHRAAARELAEKSIVLLKNNNALLPLSKNMDSVAVIGPLADEPHSCLGSWAAAGKAEDAVTILTGLKSHLPDTQITYVQGCSIDDDDTSGFAEATNAANQADAVILVLGEHRDMSAEAKCRTSIDLPGVQNDLAKAIIATEKPVVVVLMNGRPLSISWLEENAPAIVEAWYPGVEAGNAVARILLGDVNPSGKLPVTFPRSVGQIPIYYNHRNTGRPFDAADTYTTRYLDSPITPLYPFGYGLSYTSFAYDALSLSEAEINEGDSVEVTVNVTNDGEREGSEVVQLYIRDLVGDTARPVRELRGFKRVFLLPGEARTVHFTLTEDDFSCYDAAMTWRVEPGRFQIFVGGNSVDTLSKELLIKGK